MVFGLQGIGKLTYDALQNLDLPVIMATVMYASFFVVAPMRWSISSTSCSIRGCALNAEPALLEVRDLSVSFRTDRGLVRAVDGISFRYLPTGDPRHRRRSPAPARPCRCLSVMGLINDPNAVIEGSITYKGRELLGLPQRELRTLRGREIAMIFQDPMTALTPVYTIGWQIAEQIQDHERVSARAARARAVDLLRRCRHPKSRRGGRPLSAPALWRHAATRGDRHGAVVQSLASHRR